MKKKIKFKFSLHYIICHILMNGDKYEMSSTYLLRYDILYICNMMKIDLIEKCILRGDNVNLQSITTKMRPIHITSSNDHVAAVKMLLEYGADPTYKDENGNDLVIIAGPFVLYWLKSYNVQKTLLEHYPQLIFSLEQRKIIHKKIKKEFAYIMNAINLNLL